MIAVYHKPWNFSISQAAINVLEDPDPPAFRLLVSYGNHDQRNACLKLILLLLTVTTNCVNEQHKCYQP